MKRGYLIPKRFLNRLTVLAVCAVLLVQLCACMGTQSAEETPQEAPQEAPAADTPEPEPIVEKSSSEPTPDTIRITPKTEFARALAAGEIGSVLVVGDSISAGRGTDGYVYPKSGNYLFSDWEGDYYEPDPTNGSWVNKLRAYCAATGVSEFTNASIPGSSFAWLIDVPDAWVGEGADAIVVMLGTNDAACYTEEEFTSVCETALAILASRCKYLLVIAPPKNDRQDMPVITDIGTADYIIYDICTAYGYEFVSSYWALEPGTPDYNEDQTHPTSLGAQKLWDYIAEQIGLG